MAAPLFYRFTGGTLPAPTVATALVLLITTGLLVGLFRFGLPLRLAGDEIDQGRHASVARPLGYDRIVFLKMKDLELGKSGSEHFGGVHVFCMRWTTSSVGQLLEAVSLEQEQAAWRKRLPDPLKNDITEVRGGQIG